MGDDFLDMSSYTALCLVRRWNFAPELLSNPSVHFANLGNVVGWTPLLHVPEVPHPFG